MTDVVDWDGDGGVEKQKQLQKPYILKYILNYIICFANLWHGGGQPFVETAAPELHRKAARQPYPMMAGARGRRKS